MKVLMINNDGGGFAKHVELPEGMTVGELFTQHLGASARPEDYLIRVNRLPAAQDQVLVDGDRISVTPVKIEGAKKIEGAVKMEEANEVFHQPGRIGWRD